MSDEQHMYMDQQRSQQPTDIKEEEDDDVDENLMGNRTQDNKEDSVAQTQFGGPGAARKKKPSTSTNATTAQRGPYTNNSDGNNMQNHMSSDGLIMSNAGGEQIDDQFSAPQNLTQADDSVGNITSPSMRRSHQNKQ